MDKTERLGREKIGRLLLSFSLPAITGMLVQALYNVVDRIFIGNGVGTIGITGITVCFPIMVIFMAFGMLIGIGGTSYFSIKLGEQERDEAETILSNSLFLLLVVSGTLVLLIAAFFVPLLEFFGASKKALPYATEYLKIIMIGVPFQMVGYGMNNFIRAQGRPKTAMITMIIGAVLNTALDPIFIFVFDMGIKGAALATVIAQGVSALWVMSFFWSERAQLRVSKDKMKPVFEIVKRILGIGMSPFVMQLTACVIVALFNRSLLEYGGDTAISALGVIHSFAMFIVMPVIGVNQGAQPITGYNYGAGNMERVRRNLKLTIISTTAIVTAGFIITMFLPDKLIGLFNRDDEMLMLIGVPGMRIFLLMLPLVGFQISVVNFFQAIGKARQSLFLSMTRQFLILIPALLILPHFYGLPGVWMASPVSDFFAFIISVVFLYNELKKLRV